MAGINVIGKVDGLGSTGGSDPTRRKQAASEIAKNSYTQPVTTAGRYAMVISEAAKVTT